MSQDTTSSLAYLLETKKADSERASVIIDRACDWFKEQLEEAQVPYHFTNSGVQEHGGYGYFQIKSIFKGTAITLHLKIAEIHEKPFCFAEIRVRGQQERLLFPFFGEIGTHEGKLTILHYVADFLLSTQQDVTAM